MRRSKGVPRPLLGLLAAAGLFMIFVGRGPVRCDGDACGSAGLILPGLLLVALAGLGAVASARTGATASRFDAAFGRLLASPERWSESEAAYMRRLLVSPSEAAHPDARQARGPEIRAALERYEAAKD